MIPFPFQAAGFGLAGQGPQADGDPDFASVISLTHLEGPNASTTVTDQIGSKSWTASGGAQIQTGQFKFGSSSLYCSASAARILSATNAGDAFGTGDFAIEFWYRPDSTTTTQILFDTRASGSDVAPAIYISGGSLRYFTAGADRITGGSFTNGVQRHIALARVSGTTRLFIEGTQVGSSYTDSNNYINQIMALGNASYGTPGNPAAGFLDELRVTKGVGRYSANFTAPSSAFPNF